MKVHRLEVIDTYTCLKRLVDIVNTLFALIVLSPVLLFIAVLIKLDSPGPILFTQERVGMWGQHFKMYKFRTMQVDAESFKHLLAPQNEMDGPTFKMTNDPRVTRVGHFLRAHCIDELPQLLNILLGNMSIVGPRPSTPDETDEYKPWHWARFEVKPGLTCYWQVANNRSMSFDDWVKLDLKYIQDRNLFLDLLLVLKTIPVVLFGQH